MSRFQKGTVVVSIDDGCKDAYRLFLEILQPFSIPATLNIVTSWIGADNKLSRAELAELHQSPLIEIAAHGHTHANNDSDIQKSRDLLRDWLGTDGAIGFASPGSEMKIAFVRENEAKFDDMGFLYIRSAGIGLPPTEQHLTLREKAKARGYDAYVVNNTREFVYKYTDKFVNSVVVCHEHNVEDLIALTDLAMEESACVVFMFHRVEKAGEPHYDSIWNYDYDKFRTFAVYLHEKQRAGVLDLMTTKEAYAVGRTGPKEDIL